MNWNKYGWINNKYITIIIIIIIINMYLIQYLIQQQPLSKPQYHQKDFSELSYQWFNPEKKIVIDRESHFLFTAL